MSFIKPGSYIESPLKRFKLYSEPPPNCPIIDPKHVDGPPIPNLLVHHGVEYLASLFYIDIVPGYSSYVHVKNEALRALTYSQLHYLQCNILWELYKFVGKKVTPELKRNIDDAIAQVIMTLISIEQVPGDFGDGIIDPDDIINAVDFKLKEWE